MLVLDASIPVTFPPILAIGSHNKPPPQPTSKILNLEKDKFFSVFNLKCCEIFFIKYSCRTGLNLCKGANFPFGFHHSDARSENFLISCSLAVFFFIKYFVLLLIYT